MAVLQNTITSAAMADTSIILKDFLKDSWGNTTGYTPPVKEKILFDTKIARMDKDIHIIIEKMPYLTKFQALGDGRQAITNVKRIQLHVGGKSAINDLFLIEKHIEVLIGANVRGMVSSGIKQAFITEFVPITPQSDENYDMREVHATTLARSRALVTMQYELVKV